MIIKYDILNAYFYNDFYLMATSYSLGHSQLTYRVVILWGFFSSRKTVGIANSPCAALVRALASPSLPFVSIPLEEPSWRELGISEQ